MGIVIHQEKVSDEAVRQLQSICPFGAFDYENGNLTVNSACKGCKQCVKKGPDGVVTWENERIITLDKSKWQGIAVFAEKRGGDIHPVTLEMIGKAKQLAAVTGESVYALLIGCNVKALSSELLHYGMDSVFVYDAPAFDQFTVSPYSAAFYDFIQTVKPSSVLVGATSIGRSLAPKVAARCNAGLTADCTTLEMKENTDLVQIRPAFGGNIMAQIVTPNTRPQFCTARYKVFSSARRSDDPSGKIKYMPITDDMLESRTQIINVESKPNEVDISEADVIVACGRGFSKQADLSIASELAKHLHAQLACTRPLVEAGWMNPKRQIGLSGRTVKPKLIIALGISGSVQFAAGMKGSDQIVAINNDPEAPIFGIAHLGLVGDIYQIVPKLIERIQEGARNV